MPISDPSILRQFSPLDTLSDARLHELATLCFVERVTKGLDPFRLDSVNPHQAIYLLSGKLGVRFSDDVNRTIVGNTDDSKFPIDPHHSLLQEIIALTDIEIIRIDLDLLDIMMTWDQLAESSRFRVNTNHTDSINTRSCLSYANDFSAAKLKSGIFSRLPPANIEEMFHLMQLKEVKSGQTIIRQGDDGDYYYLIEAGSAEVVRALPGSQPTLQAVLHEGASFGEEALAGELKRNATVIMRSNGRLLCLNKVDFIELLKEPLIRYVSMIEMQEMEDALCIDVRIPSEYRFNHIEKAINVPLSQLRERIGTLDKDKKIIVYCKTGRRSSAAAFIFLECGFDVYVLN